MYLRSGRRCQYQSEAKKMVHRTELLFHAMKHLKSKSGQTTEEERGHYISSLLQHAKEQKMMVKDFNQHKSNGGIATAMIIDEINPSSTGKAMATEQILRVAQVRHAANAAHPIHQENAQCGAKNVTSVKTKIIVVYVVGPGTENIPKAETNTDQPIESHKAKEEAGAGIGDMHQRTQRTDPEADLPPEVPTA